MSFAVNEPNSLPRLHRRRRRSHVGGFTLMEAIGAAAMLATFMVIASQLLVLSGAQAREAERRQVALQEASNLLERLTATAWDELTDDFAGRQELSALAQARLPEGDLKLAIEPSSEPVESKRITVEIRWRNRSGELTAPTRQVAWVFNTEAGE